MKHNREEIIDALKVITKTCAEHQYECLETCPFACGGDCMFNRNTTPDEWELNENGNVWRAFV